MPTLVTSTRFNNLQDRIAAIMGTSTSGAPTTGYGQSLESAATSPVVSGTSKITAAQWGNLYIDLARARTHQIGSAFSVDALPIGDFLTNGGSTDKPLESLIITLESLMTDIENNKFTMDISTQATIQGLVSSSRSTGWNTQLTHQFTVTWPSIVARRHFFNAGGELRISANIAYNGSDSKTLEWQNMLSTAGVISFDYDVTFSNNGIGTGSSIGNYDLTGSYQTCYQSFASSYSGNNYRIRIREDSDLRIGVLVEFNDDATGTVDELVQGTLTSSASIALPDGTVNIDGSPYDTVSLTAPASANISTL